MVKGHIIVKINQIEKQTEESFYNCLEGIDFVRSIDDVTGLYDLRTDKVFRVVFQKSKKPKYFLIEIKTNGQPRFARQAVNQLLIYLNCMEEESYGMFVAPYISSAAAEICKNNNIGYADLAGNCYLSFSNVFIEKEGNPNPFKKEKVLKSLFSPKSERLLRALLNSGPREWKVADLAETADISYGLIAKVKKNLLDREWIEADTVGFQLIKPFVLLSAWTERYAYKKNLIREFYSMQDIGEIEAAISINAQDLNIRAGLTGFSGGARLAPAVRYQRVMAYVEDPEKLALSMELKEVNSGANVLLLDPYDEGVFYGSQSLGDDRIVSPIQIYLDLMSITGRGEEAGESIMEQVIKKIWSQ
jgi:hypothetical protein